MTSRKETRRWAEEDLEPDVVPGRRWLGYARRVADVTTIAAFFLLVAVAALPMGANRDWAWAPLSIMFGLIAIVSAFGVGSRSGLSVTAAERRPMLGLVACFALFVAFALWQMSTFTPPGGDAWLFIRAAEILGSAHAPIPAVASDLARNSLLRAITCGLVFLIARAICRDRGNARWLLVALAVSAVVVVSYGVAMHVSTHSCYIGSYLKKQFAYATSDFCSMSGTFVNSNSFACYVGMAITAVIALIFSGDQGVAESSYGFETARSDRFIDWVNGRRVVLFAMLLLLMGGLLMSASRAGFAATVVSVLVLCLLMMRGRWQSRDLGRVFLIGLAVFVVIGAIAGGALVGKFRGSGDPLADDPWSRLHIWRASLEALGLSPWLGWGLGGFADAYTIVQPVSILQPNDLAHSTPLETMVELGVFAVVPAWAIVLLPWVVCLLGALRRRPIHRYLPIAAFATAGVPILHSMVDFSLQMPAIGFVVSAVLGMGWSQAFGRTNRTVERFAQAD